MTAPNQQHLFAPIVKVIDYIAAGILKPRTAGPPADEIPGRTTKGSLTDAVFYSFSDIAAAGLADLSIADFIDLRGNAYKSFPKDTSWSRHFKGIAIRQTDRAAFILYEGNRPLPLTCLAAPHTSLGPGVLSIKSVSQAVELVSFGWIEYSVNTLRAANLIKTLGGAGVLFFDKVKTENQLFGNVWFDPLGCVMRDTSVHLLENAARAVVESGSEGSPVVWLDTILDEKSGVPLIGVVPAFSHPGTREPNHVIGYLPPSKFSVTLMVYGRVLSWDEALTIERERLTICVG